MFSNKCNAFVLSFLNFKVHPQVNSEVKGINNYCCVNVFYSLHNVKRVTYYTQCIVCYATVKQILDQGTYTFQALFILGPETKHTVMGYCIQSNTLENNSDLRYCSTCLFILKLCCVLFCVFVLNKLYSHYNTTKTKKTCSYGVN